MIAAADGAPESVLDEWFGPLPDDGFYPEARARRWFMKDEAFDTALRQRFGAAIERASRGLDTDWAATPRGRLALLVLLDQMRRNVFRGRAEAFAADPLALAYALEGLRLGHDRAVRPLERVFYYLPLEHAEDLAMQDRCVALFEALRAEAPPSLARLAASYLDYAERHRVVIRRFGRFPHRNALLGRVSTPEELAFLREPGSSF